jgi:signal transduction histidine kinase
LPDVFAHEAYVTQIVSNLLSNAVKFVPAGVEPRIDVSARSENGMVRLSIRDNGIGIAPEHQKHIFQIFGRVYSTKKYEGTGIGLAIAKKAAERMGGSIGVNSEPGRGSEFFVYLKEAA